MGTYIYESNGGKEREAYLGFRQGKNTRSGQEAKTSVSEGRTVQLVTLMQERISHRKLELFAGVAPAIYLPCAHIYTSLSASRHRKPWHNLRTTGHRCAENTI